MLLGVRFGFEGVVEAEDGVGRGSLDLGPEGVTGTECAQSWLLDQDVEVSGQCPLSENF